MVNASRKHTREEGGAYAGGQQKVHEHYENAHYMNCYAIMPQATYHIPPVRVSLSDLSGISSHLVTQTH